jgi:hypothetical protein
VNNTKIILRDSDEAAQPYTMQGWKSASGHFFKDEDIARYDGCTHVKCQYCDGITEKRWTACQACRNRREQERYDALPKVQWDGVGMIYSRITDRYYNDLDEAQDQLEDNQTLASLNLVVCKPNFVRPLDAEYCSDEIPEDGDLDDEVGAAMDAFNKAVEGVILSWKPDNKAVLLP